MTQHILIIDDDERLAAMLTRYLGGRGFTVRAKPDALSGLASLEEAPVDAVILDVMLPDLDGFEVCRRIRARSEVAVLMLTARGEDTDRIVGLELGADDYLPKPFNPRELAARLSAVLRRQRRAQAPAPGELLRFGALEIDKNTREVRVGGEERRLTGHQFELLLALAERAGRVQTRDQLMEAVRGEPLEAFDRSIDVHVSRIRAAIEEDPKEPRLIRTVRGVGYVFTGTP
ncbi:MAG: response regulator transcription factor [Alphaproteobacteria bacterium]|nr:response regulator transcription factor [Alphaproteobacteria bacterium]MCB9795394.1 response regulator transcription factor [Alphaproteobacteria bacterium]